jgi:hypothetical protein
MANHRDQSNPENTPFPFLFVGRVEQFHEKKATSSGREYLRKKKDAGGGKRFAKKFHGRRCGSGSINSIRFIHRPSHPSERIFRPLRACQSFPKSVNGPDALHGPPILRTNGGVRPTAGSTPVPQPGGVPALPKGVATRHSLARNRSRCAGDKSTGRHRTAKLRFESRGRCDRGNFGDRRRGLEPASCPGSSREEMALLHSARTARMAGFGAGGSKMKAYGQVTSFFARANLT